MIEHPTAGQLLIDTLRDAGVRYLFANFGSDHPAIIEALAGDRVRGVHTPRVILCPHESTALSAAHGYSAATGEPTAVFVHTDVGTANLGGAVHNAAKSRVPVFIFAGLTPYTLEGELPGSRNTVVNHLQDAPDQHGLVRQYVKWAYDIRTARNVPQVVRRGIQLALSAPRGPVYLTGAREVLAETAPRPAGMVGERWPVVAAAPAPEDAVAALVSEIDGADRAVVVTSYLGRNPSSVGLLVAAAERLGLAVVEVSAEHVNFPTDHPQHVGDEPHAAIADADVIIALDTDAPWLLSRTGPRGDAAITVVNEDPLQESIPLWYLPSTRMIRADSAIFLTQLLAASATVPLNDASRVARVAEAERMHQEIRSAWEHDVTTDIAAGRLTAVTAASTVASAITPQTIVVNEGISEASAVWRHARRTRPGTLHGNRGTSVGFSGGGALGIALASAGAPVVSFVGDGTFFLSNPSSTYWVADRYGIPVLTVVLDNGGWAATKRNLVRQYEGEIADSTDQYFVNLHQSADFAGIASAAGGAWGATVSSLEDFEVAVRTGLEQMDGGRAAVVVARLAPISRQSAERP